MKILMVNKFLYPKGGAESYMLNLAEELKRNGHEVEYFGMYDEKNTVGNSLGLYTKNMDFHSNGAERLLYPFKILYSFEAKRKIGRVIDSFKPDIVHMNNINFQLTPSMVSAVKKRGIPLVQTVHDYQMICPNHLLYNFSENKPCERCVNGSKLNCFKYKCIHQSRIKSLLGTLEAWLYKLLETYKAVDLYICPSRFLENKLKKSAGFYNEKTFMLHNFINVNETTKSQPAPKESYIVFIGRFSEEKGVELLVQTAQLLSDVNFTAVGSGPCDNMLKNIKNIHLTGFLTGDKLTEVTKNAKALIVPSICYENCPLSILEAHALGVPVITMNSGGMAELAEDGVTGTLANEPTAKSVADAVKRLICDEKKYNKIKENCEKRKKEILSSEKYCEILEDIYKTLIGGGAERGTAKGQHNRSHI